MGHLNKMLWFKWEKTIYTNRHRKTIWKKRQVITYKRDKALNILFKYLTDLGFDKENSYPLHTMYKSKKLN